MENFAKMKIHVNWICLQDVCKDVFLLNGMLIFPENFFQDSNLIRTRPERSSKAHTDSKRRRFPVFFFTEIRVFQDLARFQDQVQEQGIHVERDSRGILVLASELQRDTGPADFMRDSQGLCRSSILSTWAEDYHGEQSPFQVTPFNTACTSVRGAI